MAAEDPRSIIQEIAAQYGLPAWIPLTIAYGESGLNPQKVGDGGAAVGLFQLHDRGVGAGMGDSRYDARTNAAKMIPIIASAYQQALAGGLQGYGLLENVWFTAERPADTAAVRQNMRQAYAAMGGGGQVPDPYDNPQNMGDILTREGNTPVAASPSGSNPDMKPVVINGKTVGYYVKNPLGGWDWMPEEGPDKAPQDSAADTMNAYTSRMNALSARLGEIGAFYDTMVKTGKYTADDAFQRYTAEVTQIRDEQDNLWRNAQLAVSQGTLDLDRGRLSLDTAEGEETARRARETSEAERRLGVAEEAGRRAKTVATDILPFSVPNATSISLPLLGTMPLAQINTDTFFNQGGPGNLATLPAISPEPSVPFPQPPAPVQLPTLPMPAQPTMPAPYQPPSFEDTTKMALALLGGGFGGF